MANEVNAYFDPFSLEALMAPQESVVAKDLRDVNILMYGPNGTGKTPVATKMDLPYYVAFGKSGLSGLNHVKYKTILSWSEFKQFVQTFCDPENVAKIYEAGVCHTLILDELEVLYSYCEKYVANLEGVNKIKEGNGGYGLWADLKSEWEREMLKVIGSGYCKVFILKPTITKSGKIVPVGDDKRMLPILLNHCDIVGYVEDNGIDVETGKKIHSSMYLAGTDEFFARTRNEYFDPVIPDLTAESLTQAYYDAIDRQCEAEGVNAVTKEQRDQMYEVHTDDFDTVMDDLHNLFDRFKKDYGEEFMDIVEKELGPGTQLSKCGKKQLEGMVVVRQQLNLKAKELGI